MVEYFNNQSSVGRCRAPPGRMARGSCRVTRPSTAGRRGVERQRSPLTPVVPTGAHMNRVRPFGGRNFIAALPAPRAPALRSPASLGYRPNTSLYWAFEPSVLTRPGLSSLRVPLRSKVRGSPSLANPLGGEEGPVDLLPVPPRPWPGVRGSLARRSPTGPFSVSASPPAWGEGVIGGGCGGETG